MIIYRPMDDIKSSAIVISVYFGILCTHMHAIEDIIDKSRA